MVESGKEYVKEPLSFKNTVVANRKVGGGQTDFIPSKIVPGIFWQSKCAVEACCFNVSGTFHLRRSIISVQCITFA